MTLTSPGTFHWQFSGDVQVFTTGSSGSGQGGGIMYFNQNLGFENDTQSLGTFNTTTSHTIGFKVTLGTAVATASCTQSYLNVDRSIK